MVGGRGVGVVAHASDFLSQTMAVTLLNSKSPVPSNSEPSASGRSVSAAAPGAEGLGGQREGIN